MLGRHLVQLANNDGFLADRILKLAHELRV